jgi:hypothetical protein
MSDQDYYRVGSINSILKLIDADIKQRIIEEHLHYPKAYVEIVDTDSSVVTLASCSSYNITLNANNFTDYFSCTLKKAISWNPRTTAYNDLISVDKRKRIKIYSGQDFSSSPKYEQIFTGIITEVPEDYKFGQQENIQIRGSNFGHLLERYDGNYIDDNHNFTGTSKELISYWLDQLGVTYLLVYEDHIEFDDEEITYEDMLTGINVMLTALGPKVEAFFTPLGAFIMRDVPDGVDGDVEFEYDSSNILKLRRYTDDSDVTTIASVIGIDDDSVADETATVTRIDKFGRNTRTISSGFITTAERAEELAKDLLDMGIKYENRYEIDVALNPYIWKSSLIKIDEPSISNIQDTLVRVDSATHSYRAGARQRTKIRGHDA